MSSAVRRAGRRPSAAREWKGTASVFAALGDETRLGVLARLSEGGALSIAALTAESTVSRQAVSKHLRVLEGAGLVKGARHGRESVWELQPRGLARSRALLDAISSEWDRAIERLRAHVEG